MTDLDRICVLTELAEAVAVADGEGLTLIYSVDVNPVTGTFDFIVKSPNGRFLHASLQLQNLVEISVSNPADLTVYSPFEFAESQDPEIRNYIKAFDDLRYFGRKSEIENEQ